MIHNHDDYPHDYREIDSQRSLIYEKDWDYLLVFDACRWDAFDEYIAHCKPVRSPASWTGEWMGKTWNDDWSDVSYIAGNPISSLLENWSIEDVTENFGQYEHPEIAWDDILGTSRPDTLTNIALGLEPPVVVHYLQPHTPFIGNLGIRCNGRLDKITYPLLDERPDDQAAEYHLVKEGFVSPEAIRAAYVENLRLVWDYTKPLRDLDADIVITADHGEVLGPDEWSHGGSQNNQTRVVPWARF